MTTARLGWAMRLGILLSLAAPAGVALAESTGDQLASTTQQLVAAPAPDAIPLQDDQEDDDEGPGCGKPGQPPCPMQAWMRSELGAPLASNDLANVAGALDKLAAMSPDDAWQEWGPMSEAGAKAARDGDVKAVRKSCKDCHKAFRKPYKNRFRDRPVIEP